MKILADNDRGQQRFFVELADCIASCCATILRFYRVIAPDAIPSGARFATATPFVTALFAGKRFWRAAEFPEPRAAFRNGPLEF